MTLFVRTFEQTYLGSAQSPLLYAAGELDESGSVKRACITDQRSTFDALIAQNLSLDRVAAALGVAVVDFSRPLDLQSVCISKPWGQEIWFTGMEVRGVSQVVSETGRTPLSWLLSFCREGVLGTQHQQLNLLKILDPLPDEVFGDLYFELHEKKREVYIVTHIDRSAWPDGIGAIRYGFSAEKRKAFVDDANFIVAYRQAVRDYAAVRRDIDMQLDTLRERDGFRPDEPVSAAQTLQWLQSISAQQTEQEFSLRKAMESFTALRALREGDVLAVPLCTPHALQHGVRAIEFQTPVYERKILSFAQKVITQNHWDTEEALRLAVIDTPADQAFPVLLDDAGVKLERIVQFDDFIVQRLQLAPNAAYECQTTGSYALLMTVIGCVQCGDKALAAEQACLVPASLASVSLRNTSSLVVTVLLARPA